MIKKIVLAIAILGLMILTLETVANMRYKRVPRTPPVRITIKPTEWKDSDIICLGGSSTKGVWAEQPYPERIGALNAGVCGMDSEGMVEQAKIALQYNPKVITIYQGFNDYYGEIDKVRYHPPQWLWKILDKSQFFQICFEKINFFTPKKYNRAKFQDILSKRGSNIYFISEMCSDRGVRLIIINQKLRSDKTPANSNGKMSRDEAYNFMRRACEYLDALNPPLTKDCFIDMVHLNDRGHKIIADTIKGSL